ncbi:DUF4037 domain-containing protein [Alloscardovia omnicolens]|uniref:DUF4037 domain-containing protein n=1 Tax=Alloscardovia omnicolens TaxID=419015 RepID=UPI003A69F613
MSKHNAPFNVEKFYTGLDQIFAEHRASTDALPYLQNALSWAQEIADTSAELSVISEFLGFDRSHGRHDHARTLCQRALELRDILHLENTPESTIILINVATAYRQAGEFSKARTYYELAAQEADTTLPDTDRQKAALYNNFSMLDSDMGDYSHALTHLERALALMQISSSDPENDPDVATTLTNLGLLELQARHAQQALAHTKQALDIYERNAALQESAHFTSALAGYAQVLFVCGQLADSARYYERAVQLIAKYYGESSDYYVTTQSNLNMVREALGETLGETHSMHHATSSSASSDSSPSSPEHIPGLQLARMFWQASADTLFADDLAQLRSRTAVGLVGHGSECYGFDDAVSRDHDFGSRFCLWLTEDDYARYGEQLQHRYDALPSEFMGFSRSAQSPRGGGRDGVLSIDTFFESITGLSHAPTQTGEEHVWLSLDEATLAAATNGEIFADPLGAFSSRRQGFKTMPDDVHLYLISQRLGMIAQTAQYNYGRMLQRGDTTAAALSAHEFVMNVSSLIFLLNNPISVGYAPYYKWRFAALRRLSRRMAAQLADLVDPLEQIATQPLDSNTQSRIDAICARIVQQLHVDGLTASSEEFLEWHRPYIEAHIRTDNPILHSL